MSSRYDVSETPESILGSLMVERLHAHRNVGLVSGAAHTWTGVKAGWAFAANADCVYGADSNWFHGKPVVQCAATGTHGLLYNPGSTIFTTAQHPWIGCIGRIRTLGAGGMFGIGSAAAGTFFQLGFSDISGSGAAQASLLPGGGQSVAFTPNLSPHMFADGITGAALTGQIDQTALSTSAGTDFGAAITKASIGMRPDSAGGLDFSAAELWFCSAIPRVDQINRLWAYAHEEWL